MCLRRLLVLAEVSLSVLLLIAAGLLLRSFWFLNNLSPGFDPDNVLVAKTSLQDARYRDANSINQLFEKSLSEIRALPGVRAAAIGFGLPYERPLATAFRRLDGPQVDGPRDYRPVNLFYVTPELGREVRGTGRRTC